MSPSAVNQAMVGYTGFAGSTLTKQASFDSLYRSSNVETIRGRSFSRVVCAAAPAKKWLANKDPAADLANIEALISHLEAVETGMFVLVSTVDVFKEPVGVDEETRVDENGLSAYGAHRRLLERFIESRFENHVIVRLPGLVGPGLRKNVIFDLLNDNNLSAVDSRGVFQFYPMVNLWCDIERAILARLRLVHLTAEPLSVGDVAALGFGKPFHQVPPDAPASPARYDMRTCHAGLFGGTGHYQYSRRESLLAVRAFAQSEPLAKVARPV